MVMFPKNGDITFSVGGLYIIDGVETNFYHIE